MDFADHSAGPAEAEQREEAAKKTERKCLQTLKKEWHNRSPAESKTQTAKQIQSNESAAL